MIDLNSPNSILSRARRNAASRLDFDNNKVQYIAQLLDYDVKFTSPLPYTLEQAKFLLLFDATVETLSEKYVQRPDLLSYDRYGTEQLDWVLMYVNDVFCYEEFVGQVYVPTLTSITRLTEFQLPAQLRQTILVLRGK